MARYLYRSCPECGDYLGVVIPEPPEPVREVLVEATCMRCGYRLDWSVSYGVGADQYKSRERFALAFTRKPTAYIRNHQSTYHPKRDR